MMEQTSGSVASYRIKFWRALNSKMRTTTRMRFSPDLSARVRTNVILAGKCDSQRHSTTSLSENVVVAKKSYQMLGILSFSDRERALPLSTEITSEPTFVAQKSSMMLSGVSVFREWRKN